MKNNIFIAILISSIFVVSCKKESIDTVQNEIVSAKIKSKTNSDKNDLQYLDLEHDPFQLGGISTLELDSFLNQGWYLGTLNTDVIVTIGFKSSEGDQYYETGIVNAGEEIVASNDFKMLKFIRGGNPLDSFDIPTITPMIDIQ